LSTYVFLAVFFLNAQWTRVDDLHFLQLVTIPDLRAHNLVYLSDTFRKGSIIR
jgi:hypothetical protein